MSNETNRRGFFKLALTSLASLTVASKAIAAACKAKAIPAGKKVARSVKTDKAAWRLQYTENASKPVGKKKPKTPLDLCGNCKYYKGDASTPGYGKCTMLRKRYVTECGWCKSYRVDKVKLKTFPKKAATKKKA